MAPTKRAAAAKKAAATRAAKKEAAAAAVAFEGQDDQVAEASTSTAEATRKDEPVDEPAQAEEEEDVKPAASSAKATRATRGAASASAKKGKKAAAVKNEEMEAEQPAAGSVQAGAASNIADEPAIVASTTAALPVKEEVPTAAPASEAGAPDIAGVIEAREDEDLAMDDTEPPPMDSEEVRRLRERPAEARETSGAMPLITDSSAGIAQQQTQAAAEIRQAVQSEGVPPAGGLAGIQEPSATTTAEGAVASGSMTREERMAKMNALRKRMNDSAQANRKDVITAQNEHRKNIQESKRLERKRKQAEAMGEKLDAMETGEDLERKRNWEYSLEDNEKWNKKQDRKERRADHGLKDYDDSARRKYKRDMDAFKPDLEAYRGQREQAIANGMAIEAGPSGSAGSSMDLIHGYQSGSMIPGGDQLYRDANSFVYADHKPSDDAIDRVVGQINQDIDKRAKRSRVRNEEDDDVTYINDRNKVFNKKLERYFNKYTNEIKQNFERGTAL